MSLQTTSMEGPEPLRAAGFSVRAAGLKLRRALASSLVLSLADQAVVSATSFTALVLIGRWAGPGQLGIYALGTSILALLLATQSALVTRPYTIQLNRPVGTPAEHASTTLVLCVLLAGVTSAVIAATALALFVTGARRELIEITLALAGAAPFVLVREFARRFAFAHLKMRLALAVDLPVAVLTVGAIVGLALSGQLLASTAVAAVGVSCAIAAAGWFYAVRREFALRIGQVSVAMKQSWALGKWFLSGQLALQIQSYATPWLAMTLAGATVTGIYAACASIVGLANPLLFGFFNILTPKSVRALQQGGVTGLRRRAARDAVGLGLVMAAFGLFIVVAGESIMQVLYPGAEYRGHGLVLSVLAFAMVAGAVGVPASIGLATTERGRAVAGVTAGSALLNIALVAALLPGRGLVGAAYGMLAAEIVASLALWIVFLTLVRAEKTP